VQLIFEAPEVEASSAPPPYDLLLGVVATVRLLADDGHLVYEEVMVPIVELALALDDWLATDVDAGIDFSYDSLETDGPDQLWCRLTAGGWLVGSVDETEPDHTVHTTAAVVDAFSTYVRGVDTWIDRALGRRTHEART
jgi:hypothetical protein